VQTSFYLVGFDLWTFMIPNRSFDHLSILYETVSVFYERWTWVTYISNILSNKTILFDILDFWCQLVVIRSVKTLSKRRMFVSSMKISACWLLHRLIKFNKICWEKRPAKTRPNLRTSFYRRDLKKTQPHLNREFEKYYFWSKILDEPPKGSSGRAVAGVRGYWRQDTRFNISW